MGVPRSLSLALFSLSALFIASQGSDGFDSQLACKEDPAILQWKYNRTVSICLWNILLRFHSPRGMTSEEQNVTKNIRWSMMHDGRRCLIRAYVNEQQDPNFVFNDDQLEIEILHQAALFEAEPFIGKSSFPGLKTGKATDILYINCHEASYPAEFRRIGDYQNSCHLRVAKPAGDFDFVIKNTAIHSSLGRTSMTSEGRTVFLNFITPYEPLPRVTDPSAIWEDDERIHLTWRLPVLGSCVKAFVVMVKREEPSHSTTAMTSTTPAGTKIINKIQLDQDNSTAGQEELNSTTFFELNELLETKEERGEKEVFSIESIQDKLAETFPDKMASQIVGILEEVCSSLNKNQQEDPTSENDLPRGILLPLSGKLQDVTRSPKPANNRNKKGSLSITGIDPEDHAMIESLCSEISQNQTNDDAEEEPWLPGDVIYLEEEGDSNVAFVEIQQLISFQLMNNRQPGIDDELLGNESKEKPWRFFIWAQNATKAFIELKVMKADPTESYRFYVALLDQHFDSFGGVEIGLQAVKDGVTTHEPATTTASTTTTTTPSTISPNARCPRICFPDIQSKPPYCFGSAPAGVIHYERCPIGSDGSALLECDSSGMWMTDYPDTSRCNTIGLSAEFYVEQMELMNVTPAVVIQTLRERVLEVHHLQGGDLLDIAIVMKESISHWQNSTVFDHDFDQAWAFAQEMVELIDVLLDPIEFGAWTGLPDANKTQMMTNIQVNADEAAFHVAHLMSHFPTIGVIGNSTSITDQGLDPVLVRSFQLRHVAVYMIKASVGHLLNNDVYFGFKGSNMRIPRRAFSVVFDELQTANLEMTFVAFSSLHCVLGKPLMQSCFADEIEPDDVNMDTEPSNDDEPSNATQRFARSQSRKESTIFHLFNNANVTVNSYILGASVGKLHKNFELGEHGPQIRFVHETPKPTPDAAVFCVFWDNKQKNWSDFGCQVVETDENGTTCFCNHLTNFAVLMDIHGVMADGGHEPFMVGITMTGCILSMACLALATMVFAFTKGIPSDRRTIHAHLCTSLFAGQFFLLTGLDRTGDRVFCKIVAGLLHFLFLSAFTWMLLEGVQIYLLLVKVFKIPRVRPAFHYLIGYGLPAFIVSTTTAATGGKAYATDFHCWINHEEGHMWAFAGPVGLILVINTGFLIVGLRMALSHKMVQQGQNRSQTITWIKGSASLSSILGLTWIFGFMFVSDETYVFGVIFAALNSCQGVFIFCFHVVFNARVRRELLKTLGLRIPCLATVPGFESVFAQTRTSRTSKNSSSIISNQQQIVHLYGPNAQGRKRSSSGNIIGGTQQVVDQNNTVSITVQEKRMKTMQKKYSIWSLGSFKVPE